MNKPLSSVEFVELLDELFCVELLTVGSELGAGVGRVVGFAVISAALGCTVCT